MTLSGKPSSAWAEVDQDGRLIIPPALAEQYGLTPGARVRLEEGTNFMRLHRPITQLTKVYIEPTVDCNLNCITCFRNSWDQPGGKMSEDTFERILAGLKQLDPIPSVYFGGIGEPLFHPKTIDWIWRIKELGVKVEMITNGTTLTEKKSTQLIESGLDVLWVSLDGATPESYADIRIGAELEKIIASLKRFAKMRKASHFPLPEIGIAFVAMKRNIQDLPEIIKIGKTLRAKYFSVSNVQPNTQEMLSDLLYPNTIRNIAYMNAPHLPQLNLPKMDFDETTREVLFNAFNSQVTVSYAGQNWSGASDTCTFVENGTMSIAWNGDVSPCWPLMHNHTSYLHGKPRVTKKHVIGSVNDRTLNEIWLDREYVAYRTRLHNFAFAPCTFCGGCDLSESNEEDCIGNDIFPVCGGCLWAQGIIQCP